MYESKKTPGKKFGSIFAGKHYDENHSEDGVHSESPEHEAKESPEFEAGEQEGAAEHEHNDHAEEEHDNAEVHPVVAEHGKAHKVVIHHDEKAGRHTVTSHHKDGHVHSAVHEVPEEAHKDGRVLAGVPADGQEKEHESPFHQGKAQAGTSSEEDGFAMPDLH